MGLISDYLEENRERTDLGCVDPCMLMSNRGKQIRTYKDVYKELALYSGAEREQQYNLARKLQQRLIDLEQLKASYLIADKILIEVKSKEKFHSVLIKNMLDIFTYQIRQGYKGISELVSEIKEKIGGLQQITFGDVDENEIRSNLLEEMIGSVVYHFSRDLIADTSEIRKVIDDCGRLIVSLERKTFLMGNKRIFQYYIENKFNLKDGHLLCKNCGKPLKNELNYCLNCYERNA